MLKRLLLLFVCLLLACPALAEDVPTLPGQFTLDTLPKDLTFDVYTGPGTNYHRAGDGKAKVSTNGSIQCYGRIGDTGWMLIRYEVSSSQVRVGCIDLNEYPDIWQRKREVELAEDTCLLPSAVKITDDPYRSCKTFGTVSGMVTLLAWRGTNWAYVEGILDDTGEMVRGFIPRTSLDSAMTLPGVVMSPYAGERFNVTAEYDLNLPDDTLADGMNVYPLADGSYLIAYHCQNSSKLWMRVISEKGKKVWAKSVEELYLSQITVTETGFICQTFDNSECDSGMRYTYTCKGNKWKSEKVTWINEPDRYYADNTASFTLLRHTFVEGGQPMPIEITNRLTGASLLSETYTFKPFLHEMDGVLLLLDEAADGTLSLRMFSEDLTDVARVAAPAALADRWNILVQTADHARNAVYFAIQDRGEWQLWRLDRETLTFADDPLAVPMPYGSTGLTLLSANASGTHDALVHMPWSDILCQITPVGQVLMHQALPGQLAWVSPVTEGSFLLILQNSEGEFILQHYTISEG